MNRLSTGKNGLFLGNSEKKLKIFGSLVVLFKKKDVKLFWKMIENSFTCSQIYWISTSFIIESRNYTLYIKGGSTTSVLFFYRQEQSTSTLHGVTASVQYMCSVLSFYMLE